MQQMKLGLERAYVIYEGLELLAERRELVFAAFPVKLRVVGTAAFVVPRTIDAVGEPGFFGVPTT